MSALVTTDWPRRAACGGLPKATKERFFPQGATRQRNIDVEAAKAICRGCPVRVECGDYAIDTLEPHGIWGGMTGAERERVRVARVRWT